MPDALSAGSGKRGYWQSHTRFARQLLANDPAAIIAALTDAIHAGATATDLSRSLAYAAALRVAWFGTANEHSDWEAAHHAFTYCNGLHQLLKRITVEPDKLRGKPCIRGMRIRVQDILEMLAGGASEEEILGDFPYLERDDIRAALAYAAAHLAGEADVAA